MPNSCAPALLLLLSATMTSVGASTQLLYDREPNDTPHEAQFLALPDWKESVRILGELEGRDQDAYRIVIDEDRAARRIDLQLTGRSGALTALDVYDFTEFADGRGRIPEELDRRPGVVVSLRSTDGSRPTRVDGLLLSPGVYVLGVFHSGGEGSYSIEIGFHDEGNVEIIADSHVEDEPGWMRTDRRSIFWTQGETWFYFDLDEEAAENAWRWGLQTPAGRDATAELIDADDQVLLTLDSGTGVETLRHGLTLAAGHYRIRTRQQAAGIQMIRFEPGAAVAKDGREVEPNDRIPNPVEFGETIAGDLSGSDKDNLVFTVDEARAAQVFDLEVSAVPEVTLNVCLSRKSIALEHCRSSREGTVSLRTLNLSAGEYHLSIWDQSRGESDWTLTWNEQGEVRPGEEVEPNDYRQHAVLLDERGIGRGHFDGNETDYWRFSVTGEPQLWRAQLLGDGIDSVSLQTGAGKQVSSHKASGDRRIRLDNQFLMPGEYFLAASGTDSDYVLRMMALGPPPEGMELEPNDEVPNAGSLKFGIEHFGTLAEKGDTDLFGFRLNGHERIRITVQPPADGSIDGSITAGDAKRFISNRSQREPGAPLEWELFLPPATYYLQLKPRKISDAEYTIRMERLDPLEPVADREPNNGPEEASPLPPDGRITGLVVDQHAEQDWFELPVQAAARTIELKRISGLHLYLYAESAPGTNRLVREADRYHGELAAGERHWLKLTGAGIHYDYDLSDLTGWTDPGETLPLAIELQLDREELQAYSPWAQRLGGRLTLTNPADRARELTLETRVTDVRWMIEREPGPFRLDPGESRAIDLVLEVPPDIAARPSALVFAHVHDRYGRDSASSEIRLDVDAAPVGAVFHWPVPEPLRGGFNAAAANFGAEPVASPNMDDRALAESATLYDGLARIGGWTEFNIPMGRGTVEDFHQPTVRLAGSEPVPVAGFLLNPTANTVPHGFLRDFQVAVSTDGVAFETVFTGRLEPIAEEQAFVLEQPVPARYVRLIPVAPHFAYTGYNAVRLGEFKVIAERGWRPPGAPFNIADPELGGHLVWADPWVRGSTYNKDLLLANDKTPEPHVPGRDHATVVLGFHNARAARIDRVAILPLAEADEENRPTAVRLAVADYSPLGPWEPVAEADLGAGETEIELDAPAWARYLRFIFELPEDARLMQVADRLAVYEAAGESVLGEWGFYDDVGPMEAADTPVYSGLDGAPPHDSRDNALVLTADTPGPGRALLDTYSSWYRLDVPADTNHLLLRIDGRPTVEAIPRLFDARGDAVDLYAQEQSVIEHTWEAFVEPGQSYWLELYEPPRSVIFSWDTSGSVSRYLPFIAKALRTYAETIKPGRDEVNLLPFGRSPLLKEWIGHPYPLMKILNMYPHDSNSSAAVRTLATAARELAPRPGKKGVVFLTDAATTMSASDNLWPALHEGQPQVFAMKLTSEGASSDPRPELDLMQDWARVRGGQFSYVTSFGALDHGFERAVARLKAPVDFSVAATYDYVDDPTPATIAVVSGQTGATGGDAAARGAIEIILDASGSMLKRMGGERRIDIAKAAVQRTVEETLPEGMPLALRVYGHREAGSCRTDLEIPLAPLDQAAFLGKLAPIEAINLARTPIADSLAAVASDLADSEGRRLVVLLTDGEETCDGDPAAEIEKLKEAGFDVRINIVGFAIDDDELKGEFAEWARLGGGEYLDAGEAEALDEAMARALQVPFVVVDDSGQEIARGLVDGEPVEVPPGRYGVKVEATTTRSFRDIRATPGKRVELNLTSNGS